MTVQLCFLLRVSLLIACASVAWGAKGEQPQLIVQNLIDLQRDGVGVIAFSSATRELFVAHSTAETKLYQWNMDEKKLLHTYLCPKDSVRWSAIEVSPDGKLLIASNYPSNYDKTKVFFIDTQTHEVRFTAEYEHGLVSKIRFDHSGQFIWITMTYPGQEQFVYDRDGKKLTQFNSRDFQPKTHDRLWDVEGSKVGPPAGLFYRDANDVVHRLIDSPLNQYYAFSVNEKYIGTSTADQHVRIWRTSDLVEVFNKKMGAHPVKLLHDSKEDQFLVLDGDDGNTHLRAIPLPKKRTDAPQR